MFLVSPRLLQYLLFVGGPALARYAMVGYMILATGARDAAEDIGVKKAALTYTCTY